MNTKATLSKLGDRKHKANAGLNPTHSTTRLSCGWSTLCGILGDIS